MDDKVKLVVCCGMSRSGSTLQYQLVKAILEHVEWGQGVGFANKWDESSNAIVKAERYAPWLGEMIDEGTAVGVSIHRDPRQVAISLLHFYTKRSEWQSGPLPTWWDVIGDWLPKAIEWHDKWTTHGVPSFCYENSYDQLMHLGYRCAEAVGVDPDSVDLIELTDNLWPHHQVQRTERMTKWIDNQDTLLTKNHFSRFRGQRTWDYRLTLAQIFDVQDIARDWMLRWDYRLVGWEGDLFTPYQWDSNTIPPEAL